MKYLFTIILIAFIHSCSFAQKFFTSIDAQLSVPQGDYKAVNTDAGFGLRANLLYKPSEIAPVKFGLELGMQEKGRATQYFSGYIFGYYDDFKISATNNIFSLMFLTRLQSSKPRKIKPFIYVTAVWNLFFQPWMLKDLLFTAITILLILILPKRIGHFVTALQAVSIFRLTGVMT